MHGAQHAGNEFVNSITFGDQGHQCGDPALIVGAAAEMGEDQFLESVDLILQIHEIGDRLVTMTDRLV